VGLPLPHYLPGRLAEGRRGICLCHVPACLCCCLPVHTAFLPPCNPAHHYLFPLPHLALETLTWLV